MKLQIQTILSRIVDPPAVRAQKTLAKFRVRRPQPWQCNHHWQPCPIVITGQAGRYCPRCTALEPRHDGQPLHHPESMAVLLPLPQETDLAALDDALWPDEVV